MEKQNRDPDHERCHRRERQIKNRTYGHKTFNHKNSLQDRLLFVLAPGVLIMNYLSGTLKIKNYRGISLKATGRE